MGEDMRARWGETLPLSLTDEEGAVSAIITVSQGTSFVMNKTAPFVNNVADLTLSALQMQKPVGLYSYMYSITYDDAAVLKFPDVENCSGCELPTLEICFANDNPEVS